MFLVTWTAFGVLVLCCVLVGKSTSYQVREYRAVKSDSGQALRYPHRCCRLTNKVEYVDSGQVLCVTSPANKTVAAVALRAQCTVMCDRGCPSPCQAVNYRHTTQLCELFHYEPCSFDLQPDCVNYVLQVTEPQQGADITAVIPR